MISEVRAIRGSGGGQGDARNSGGSYRDMWYSDWGRRYAWDSWGSDGANRDAWDYKDYKGDNRDTWDSDGDHGSVASAPAAGERPALRGIGLRATLEATATAAARYDAGAFESFEEF